MAGYGTNCPTTHVFTQNSGAIPQGLDFPVPPAGQICVCDWINFSANATVAVGQIVAGIREADGTHTMYSEVSNKAAAIGDVLSLRITFDNGFPIFFPNFNSGTPGTLCATTQDTGQLEAYCDDIGTTATIINFAVGYHYEPISWRSHDRI